MKKRIFVGIAMALGMLSVGAMSASAANSCCDGKSNCAEKQVVEKFMTEMAGITGALKAKEIELRELYSYDSIDPHKTADLEAEIKDLKGKLTQEAQKQGILPCCLG